MNTWIWLVLRENPKTGFFFILGAAIFVGILIGYLIQYALIRLTWRAWLPIRHQKALIQLEADLLATRRERDWYQDHYVAARATIKACSSMLTTVQLEEAKEVALESIKNEPTDSDRQSGSKEGRKIAKKT
jgi:hypothetical protein